MYMLVFCSYELYQKLLVNMLVLCFKTTQEACTWGNLIKLTNMWPRTKSTMTHKK